MRILFVLVLLALCCGCSRSVHRHGNSPSLESSELVGDALGILLSVYPPAHTRLVLLHPAGDAFGDKLIASLRSNGYAVSEFTKPVKRRGKEKPPRFGGLGFGYVLDLNRSADEFRITLQVGDESLSRLYSVQNDGEAARFIPQGQWSRRQ